MTAGTVLLYVALVLLAYTLWGYMWKDVHTMTGTVAGQSAQQIAANALDGGGSSSNFAYSIWINVGDWNYRYGEPKIIFTRTFGSANVGPVTTTGKTGSGSASTSANNDDGNPCPMVALGSSVNNLQISMNLFGDNGGPDVVQRIMVPDIPLQVWVNLTISVQGQALDVYINGKLVRTALLEGVVHVPTSAGVAITPNGGFSGWTAQFKYYNTAIDPQEAWSIYEKGYSGGNWLTNLIGNYAVKVALMKDDAEESSLTL
jgi:hypothetical protein